MVSKPQGLIQDQMNSLPVLILAGKCNASNGSSTKESTNVEQIERRLGGSCIEDTVAEQSEFDCYQEHHLREEWFGVN